MKHLALTLTLLTLTLFLICSCTSEIENTPDSTSDTLSSVVDIVDTLSPEPITTELENTSTETTSVEPSFVETTEVSVFLETAPPPTLTPMRIMWELQDNILYFPGDYSYEFEQGQYRFVSPLWQEKCVIFDLTHNKVFVAEYRTEEVILVSGDQEILQCSADFEEILWRNSKGELWTCTWTEENYIPVLLPYHGK